MPRAPRNARGATCQSGSVTNLHSHLQTISRELRSRSRIFPKCHVKAFARVAC
jgi:hypothetical protein